MLKLEKTKDKLHKIYQNKKHNPIYIKPKAVRSTSAIYKERNITTISSSNCSINNINNIYHRKHPSMSNSIKNDLIDKDENRKRELLVRDIIFYFDLYIYIFIFIYIYFRWKRKQN
jgi:hypothetical protein